MDLLINDLFTLLNLICLMFSANFSLLYRVFYSCYAWHGMDVLRSRVNEGMNVTYEVKVTTMR